MTAPAPFEASPANSKDETVSSSRAAARESGLTCSQAIVAFNSDDRLAANLVSARYASSVPPTPAAPETKAGLRARSDATIQLRATADCGAAARSMAIDCDR